MIGAEAVLHPACVPAMSEARCQITGRETIELAPRRPSERWRVELGSRPRWALNALALAVVATVVLLAIQIGGDTEVPDWINKGLIPLLGLLVAWALARTAIRGARRGFRRRRPEGRDGY